jgi:hypothetical protein
MADRPERDRREVTHGVEQLPGDDIGAETLGRFRYQAELAARFATAMLAGEPIDRIFCELHEDYVVVFSDGRRPCLVSVKHLESSQPRWTLQGLCEDGGVAHLNSRWVDTGRVASCLLQTNSGLRGGVGNAAELAEACRRGDPAELRVWATTIAPLVGADTEEDCAAFLRDLRIEDRLPDRRHLRATNLVEHMPRCLGALARGQSACEPTYDAIVGAIERASRNEIQDGAVLAMTDPDRLEIAGVLRSLLESKTITVDVLKAALDRQVPERGPFMGVLTDSVPSSAYRLKAKLEKGGVGPTGIRNARSLRLNWIGHCDRWRPDLPQAIDPFDDVASRVLSAAHEAESAVRIPGGQYGAAMESELTQRFHSSAISVPGDPTADRRLLLGCAYELTNECHIFWSDEFEVAEPA